MEFKIYQRKEIDSMSKEELKEALKHCMKRLYKEKNETAEKIFDYIVKSKKKILMMKPVTSTLEDVFVKMIKNEGEKE